MSFDSVGHPDQQPIKKTIGRKKKEGLGRAAHLFIISPKTGSRFPGKKDPNKNCSERSVLLQSPCPGEFRHGQNMGEGVRRKIRNRKRPVDRLLEFRRRSWQRLCRIFFRSRGDQLPNQFSVSRILQKNKACMGCQSFIGTSILCGSAFSRSTS